MMGRLLCAVLSVAVSCAAFAREPGVFSVRDFDAKGDGVARRCMFSNLVIRDVNCGINFSSTWFSSKGVDFEDIETFRKLLY